MNQEFSLGSLIAIFGTSQVILAALFGWLGKLWLERISRNEKSAIDAWMQKEKVRLDTQAIYAQHVSKSRFDLEIRVYGELWKAVHEMKESVAEIQFHKEVPDQPGLRSLNSKRRDFDASVKKVLQAVHGNRPFFAPSVHAACIDIVKLCQEAVDRAEEKQPRTTMIHAETVRYMISLQDAGTRLADRIRERLYPADDTLPGTNA